MSQIPNRTRLQEPPRRASSSSAFTTLPETSGTTAPHREHTEFLPALSVLKWIISFGSSVIAKVGTATNVIIGAGILGAGQDIRTIIEEMGIVEDYIMT